ncbi:MAG TPA: ABC transporter ATP-binding protein [Thermococcus sp.]|nr:ABC transporter ATP-binding protein [Thermococcus sp.]
MRLRVMSVVWAEDLAKSYGKVVAVDGLSLRVDKGSIMGLIGPNGAGKTTTIKMILGLLRPDRGQVRVFDEDPWDNPNIKSRIGIIHEKAYFPSRRKVLEYLERVCRIFGRSESRAREVLTIVNLEDAYDRKIKDLSAGMLQKFAIAHALVHEPEFVVADEPTSNLDPEARSDLLELILKLNREENVTFLISSHILPELSRVCESVAIMNQGKIWASGKLVELSEKFGAKTTRISTDKPEALAELIRKLDYVKRVEVESRGVNVNVVGGVDEKLYEDIPKLAKKVDAKVLGIESGVASLEELFRLAVRSGRGGRH